jgi:hypothetical protein
MVNCEVDYYYPGYPRVNFPDYWKTPDITFLEKIYDERVTRRSEKK